MSAQQRRTHPGHAYSAARMARGAAVAGSLIAGLTGCKARIRVDAEELREGICHTKGGDYLITTFPEQRYQETWLDSVGMYQGTYLVGSRWVVSAQPKMLKQFRTSLGGTITHLTGTGPTPHAERVLS